MSEYAIDDIIHLSAQNKPADVKQAVDYLMTDRVRDALAGLRKTTGQNIFPKSKDPRHEIIPSTS